MNATSRPGTGANAKHDHVPIENAARWDAATGKAPSQRTVRSWVGAARALALDEVAVTAMQTLESAGVDVLLIKGPVSAARLYPDAPSARDYSDVDLLVAPEQFVRAQTAFARAGYVSANAGMRPGEAEQREVTWFRPGPVRLPVDLHQSLAWVGDPTALWSGLWRNRTSMDLQGTAVWIPDAAGSVLIVALHASRAGNSRKPFRDLTRAVVVFDDQQWRGAIALARTCDALAGFALGLDTVPEARPLLTRFDLPTTVPTALRMYSSGVRPAGLSLGRLLEISGRWARLRHLGNRVLPSVAYMHKAWPASRTGRAALIRAHGQRWRRFVRTLAPGLIELWRARQGGAAGRDDWTEDALCSVRRQLTESGMKQIDPFRAPGRFVSESSIAIILQRHSATCLEGSLVRQRFFSAKGQMRELIVGVSAPRAGFRAHAWLSGDRDEGSDYHIIHRVPPLTAQPVLPHRLARVRYRNKTSDDLQRREVEHGR